MKKIQIGKRSKAKIRFLFFLISFFVTNIYQYFQFDFLFHNIAVKNVMHPAQKDSQQQNILRFVHYFSTFFLVIAVYSELIDLKIDFVVIY